jgi:hypothetical protein
VVRGILRSIDPTLFNDSALSAQDFVIQSLTRLETIKNMLRYKYYVFGHYRSSFLYLKRHPVYFSKHNVSETGLILRLQLKPTQLGPIDRGSHYFSMYFVK